MKEHSPESLLKVGSQLLMMVQYFIALEALMLPIIVILISILPCLVL
nr:MAG TPA: hypothetical protein [Bacteriophage sp.]